MDHPAHRAGRESTGRQVRTTRLIKRPCTAVVNPWWIPRSVRGVKDEPTGNTTSFRVTPFRLLGEGPPGQRRLVPEGVPGHADGRNAAPATAASGPGTRSCSSKPAPVSPLACTTTTPARPKQFDEACAALDHISFQVQGREGLEAWGDWLDSLGIAHSGIQSKKEPFVYSTIMFRDLDNIRLEFAAIDV